MEVESIIWLGSATDNRAEMTEFFRDRLGMRVALNVKGFTRLTTADGDRVEFFGPDSVEHDQLDTGPVAGFWVEDIEEAHRDLRQADVPDVSDLELGEDGHRWFYFRAPDGNFYELCEHPDARPVRGKAKG